MALGRATQLGSRAAGSSPIAAQLSHPVSPLVTRAMA